MIWRQRLACAGGRAARGANSSPVSTACAPDLLAGPPPIPAPGGPPNICTPNEHTTVSARPALQSYSEGGTSNQHLCRLSATRSGLGRHGRCRCGRCDADKEMQGCCACLAHGREHLLQEGTKVWWRSLVTRPGPVRCALVAAALFRLARQLLGHLLHCWRLCQLAHDAHQSTTRAHGSSRRPSTHRGSRSPCTYLEANILQMSTPYSCGV